MAKTFTKKNGLEEPRINFEIKGLNEVRLIYKEHKDETSENDFNKVVSWREAVRLSKEKELDLIEVNPNTNPVIIRLANYSKYMYDLKKQQKQCKQKKSVLKEIRLTVNISSHDMEIKVKKAKEFLEEGDKVKVVLKFKGREMSRREESKKSLLLFMDNLLDSGLAAIDCPMRDEAKNSYVIFKHKN